MKFEIQQDEYTGDVAFSGSFNPAEVSRWSMHTFERAHIDASSWDDSVDDILRTLAILFEVYERTKNEEPTE